MSDETTIKPNTAGLLAHAQRKSEAAQRRVHQTIDQLLLSFNLISGAFVPDNLALLA